MLIFIHSNAFFLPETHLMLALSFILQVFALSKNRVNLIYSLSLVFSCFALLLLFPFILQVAAHLQSASLCKCFLKVNKSLSRPGERQKNMLIYSFVSPLGETLIFYNILICLAPGWDNSLLKYIIVVSPLGETEKYILINHCLALGRDNMIYLFSLLHHVCRGLNSERRAPLKRDHPPCFTRFRRGWGLCDHSHLSLPAEWLFPLLRCD